MMIGPDFLAGLERRALVLAVVLAGGAFLWPSGGALLAAAVLGGALLAGISYWGIRSGVDGLTKAVSGGTSARAGVVRSLTMLVGRYALLALIAYVMISRLRLSPLGLLLGVSVIPLAATIEVLAALKTSARGNQ
jgi:hypothetical protein